MFITYLGLPLSNAKLHVKDFTPTICKHEKYLAWWKGTLNEIARTTLVTSVLTTLPVYATGALAFFYTTIDTMIKRDRAFIWTGDNRCNKGQCKVAWDDICMPKENGGLGIKVLKKQNQCLL